MAEPFWQEISSLFNTNMQLNGFGNGRRVVAWCRNICTQRTGKWIPDCNSSAEYKWIVLTISPTANFRWKIAFETKLNVNFEVLVLYILRLLFCGCFINGLHWTLTSVFAFRWLFMNWIIESDVLYLFIMCCSNVSTADMKENR